MDNKPPRVLVIGGPTASGKSWLAVALAQLLGGTVINADSLQLYKDLPILTAQPDAAAMQGIPHRLYGTITDSAASNAALWCGWADAAIEAALEAGSVPIVVGGTGLYLEALMRGLSAIPDVPPRARQRARDEFDSLGRQAFRDRLVASDPASARLKPGDTQRLLRAWEVFAATGRPLGEWQQPAQGRPVRDYRRVAVLPARNDLYAACNGRFLTMLQAGAVDQVRQFRQDQGDGMPVTRALGYQPVCNWLDGTSSEAQMIEAAQADTRHYAKRQTTWFRNRFQAEGIAAVIDHAPAANDAQHIAALFTSP